MKEFNPYLYKAKITKVYDGDTCTAIIDFGFHIQNDPMINWEKGLVYTYRH